MRILLTGANGFIGSAVRAHLGRSGHEVVSVTRSRAGPSSPLQPAVTIDIARAVRPADWIPHLAGIDAVVNCAGLLQDAPGQSTRAVHVEGVGALFAACEAAGMRRVIHISAIGADREQPTAFSRTKFEADQSLAVRDLDWVILRPSVVVGRSAYGGSALMRGLAALPVLPVMPDSGLLQIVQLDDVVRTVGYFLQPGAPARVTLDVAGPERLTFTEVVLAYRRWLGWPAPVQFDVPRRLASVAYRAGDFAGWLGWRPPIRSTARLELSRGAVGETGEWRRVTGIEPQSLAAALAQEPASVQERWFAALYLLKPVAFAAFALFWMLTGIISLGPGWASGKALMAAGGIGDPLGSLTVLAGAIADILIGVAIAFRRTTRLGLVAALAISLAYAVIGTALLPGLWADPLGPMLKILPILVFNLMLLAIHQDR